MSAVELHPNQCGNAHVAYVPRRPAVRQTAAEAVAFLRRTSDLVPDPTGPRGRGQPVLVLPVIGRGDRHAAPIRRALTQLGYRAFAWDLGTNVGPTPQTLAGLEQRLLRLHAQHGRLIVVGFSLGGVFARFLGHLHPGMVSQVATVCSPFRATIDSAFLPLRPLLRVWRTPNLPELARSVARKLPVPGTFIFSRNDGIVAWESCVEPSQPEDCFEILGRHVTITRDPDVLAILARRFARDLPP